MSEHGFDANKFHSPDKRGHEIMHLDHATGTVHYAVHSALGGHYHAKSLEATLTPEQFDALEELHPGDFVEVEYEKQPDDSLKVVGFKKA